jgi:hypothetical protein
MASQISHFPVVRTSVRIAPDGLSAPRSAPPLPICLPLNHIEIQIAFGRLSKYVLLDLLRRDGAAERRLPSSRHCAAVTCPASSPISPHDLKSINIKRSD